MALIINGTTFSTSNTLNVNGTSIDELYVNETLYWKRDGSPTKTWKTLYFSSGGIFLTNWTQDEGYAFSEKYIMQMGVSNYNNPVFIRYTIFALDTTGYIFKGTDINILDNGTYTITVPVRETVVLKAWLPFYDTGGNVLGDGNTINFSSYYDDNNDSLNIYSDAVVWAGCGGIIQAGCFNLIQIEIYCDA